MDASDTVIFMNYIPLEFCSVQPAQLYEAALKPWKASLGKGRKRLGIFFAGAQE